MPSSGIDSVVFFLCLKNMATFDFFDVEFEVSVVVFGILLLLVGIISSKLELEVLQKLEVDGIFCF